MVRLIIINEEEEMAIVEINEHRTHRKIANGGKVSRIPLSVEELEHLVVHLSAKVLRLETAGDDIVDAYQEDAGEDPLVIAWQVARKPLAINWNEVPKA